MPNFDNVAACGGDQCPVTVVCERDVSIRTEALPSKDAALTLLRRRVGQSRQRSEGHEAGIEARVRSYLRVGASPGSRFRSDPDLRLGVVDDR